MIASLPPFRWRYRKRGDWRHGSVGAVVFKALRLRDFLGDPLSTGPSPKVSNRALLRSMFRARRISMGHSSALPVLLAIAASGVFEAAVCELAAASAAVEIPLVGACSLCFFAAGGFSSSSCGGGGGDSSFISSAGRGNVARIWTVCPSQSHARLRPSCVRLSRTPPSKN
jgi:hypothetical protein